MSDFNEFNNSSNDGSGNGNGTDNGFVPQKLDKDPNSGRNYASYGNQQYSQYYSGNNRNKVNYVYNAGSYNTNPMYPNYYGSPKKTSGGKNVGKVVFICLIAMLAVLSVAITVLSVKNPGQPTAENAAVAAAEDASELKINDSAKNTPAITDNDSTEISKSSDGNGASASCMDPKDIYKKIKDASVGVLVGKESGSGIYIGDSVEGEGSGVVVEVTEKYSYIITCAHVVADGGRIRVQLSDESQYDAQLIGSDARTDIAVLRIEKTGLTKMEIGDSDLLEVGETVYAIGNPGGVDFAGSFTNGMVSAIARPISSEIGYQMVCIQHTAAINPGNSGGALVNERGQLVGINSSKIASTDYEGMGFSVPSSTFVKVYNEIIKHGYVTNRPKLGIRYYPVTAVQTYAMLVSANNLPSGSIVIESIDSESPLKNEDVVRGDVIIAVNGKDLVDVDYLPDLVENSKVGDQLTLTICRFDKDYKMTKFDVTVKLVEDKGTGTYEEETTSSPQEYFDPFDYFGYGYGN